MKIPAQEHISFFTLNAHSRILLWQKKKIQALDLQCSDLGKFLCKFGTIIKTTFKTAGLLRFLVLFLSSKKNKILNLKLTEKSNISTIILFYHKLSVIKLANICYNTDAHVHAYTSLQYVVSEKQ